jgi:hypothetical protein
MKYIVQPASKIIHFVIDVADRELIDKLAFIHLIAMKFSGEEHHSSCTLDEYEKLFHFQLRFPNRDECLNAKAHCDRNLSETGSVVDDYKGALDAADPKRTMASFMKERAEKNCDVALP